MKVLLQITIKAFERKAGVSPQWSPVLNMETHVAQQMDIHSCRIKA